MPHSVVALSSLVGEDRAHGLLRGRPLRQTARPAMADGRLFSVGGQARLYIARQNSRPPPSSAALRPFRFAAGAGPVRPPPFVAMKAAMGAVDPTKGSTP